MSIAEYVWIDAYGNLRSKAKTLDKIITKVDDLPSWNFDGSSTDQAEGTDSEIILQPVFFCSDPFRKQNKNNILVMCECYETNGDPAIGNNRYDAKKVFDRMADQKPWYGLEQEYTLFSHYGRPLGWPQQGEPLAQGPYYCGVGCDRVFGREFAEAHYDMCLYAGLKVSGINGEVAPGQWEFQIGPVEGIEAADQLWLARYIMYRLGEYYEVVPSLHPKPVAGEWNGSGCHMNFSTEQMRNNNGIGEIMRVINNMSEKHSEHIKEYGECNDLRMTGKHETSSYKKFSWGIANRSASVRIGNETAENRCGYFEDRRPASNVDPYLCTKLILECVEMD